MDTWFLNRKFVGWTGVNLWYLVKLIPENEQTFFGPSVLWILMKQLGCTSNFSSPKHLKLSLSETKQTTGDFWESKSLMIPYGKSPSSISKSTISAMAFSSQTLTRGYPPWPDHVLILKPPWWRYRIWLKLGIGHERWLNPLRSKLKRNLRWSNRDLRREKYVDSAKKKGKFIGFPGKNYWIGIFWVETWEFDCNIPRIGSGFASTNWENWVTWTNSMLNTVEPSQNGDWTKQQPTKEIHHFCPWYPNDITYHAYMY